MPIEVKNLSSQADEVKESQTPVLSRSMFWGGGV